MTIEGLEVVEVSKLAWLTDAFAADESLVAEELEAGVHIVEEAHEEKHGANARPSASLSRVAVHDQHVLRISFQPVVALFGYLVEEGEGWSVVVWPMVISHAATKVSLRIISGSLRSILYPILVSMFVVQERRHFIDRVTIQALETTRRIAHSDDTIVDDISEIKAEIFIDKASSSAAD